MDEEIGVKLSLKDRPQFKRDTEKVQDDIQGIGRAAEKAERKSSGAFSKISGGVMGVGTMAVRAGGIFAALGGAAVGGIVALGVSSATAYEQAEIAFTTMLGSAENARSFMEDLEAFGQRTPFELPGLIAASQNMMAFGFASEEVLPMLQTLGDTAAGLNMGTEGMDRMVRALGQMRAKGRATTEEMMQLTEVGVNGFQMIADHLGISVADAMEKITNREVDFATAQEALMSGMTEQFGGLMEAQSSTIGGMWSNLVDVSTKSARLLVTPFQGQIKSALQGAIDLVTVFADKFQDDLPKAVDAFKWALAGGGFNAELDGMVGRAGELGDVAYRIRDAWAEGGLSGVVDTLDEAMGAGGLLSDTFDSVSNMIEDAGTILTDLLLPVIGDLADMLPGVNTPMEAMESLLDFIADNASTLKPIVMGLVAAWTAHKVITLGVNAAQAAGNAISFITTTRTLGLAAAQAAATTSTGALAAGTGILNAVMSMNPIALVVIALVGLAAALMYAWQNSETFRNVVTGAFETVKGVVTGVFDWISNNWPTLLAILTGPFGLAVLAITKNWDSIKEGALGAVNAIIRAWNGLDIAIGPYKIPDWVPMVGGKEFHIADVFPDIGYVGGGGSTAPTSRRIGGMPVMHDGGMTTSGGAAVIQPDEEMVVLPPAASVIPTPEGSIPERVWAGGDDGPTVLQLVVDGKVLAEQTYQHTRDKVARR